jgi:hypothetical protein
MKAEYKGIKTLCRRSGFTWDENLKMIIAAPDAWNEFIKVSLVT